MPNDTQRRVVILGAGASVCCGIPIAKDIFGRLMHELRVRESSDAALVDSLVEYLYPSFDRNSGNYPNFEDFLNQLEMARRFNSEEFIRSRIRPTKKLELVKIVCLMTLSDYIWYLMSRGKGQDVYRAFTSKFLQGGETVISFNWDTALERALAENPHIREICYSYSKYLRDGQTTVLKPHGSIDWEPRVRLTGKPAKRIAPRLFEYQPLVLAPVADKQISLPLFRDIWRGVYQAVSQATQLHIIGYSLPKEDQFARFVLRRAIRNNMVVSRKRKKKKLRTVVVNPDRSTREVFANLLGGNPRFMRQTFEQFVNSIS